MKVFIGVPAPHSEAEKDLLKLMVLQDLRYLSRVERADPVITDMSAWLCKPLQQHCKPVAGTLYHFTLRDQLVSEPAIERKFTVQPKQEALDLCDMAVFYFNVPDYDFSEFYDLLISQDKEWIERPVNKNGGKEDIHYSQSPMAPKWMHAINKAMQHVRRLPNAGVQTRQIVDFRPPRNPND